MFEYLTSLLGCAHRHCTFPITVKKRDTVPAKGKSLNTTYIVCLDCGKEFPYDWEEMKLAPSRKQAA